MSFWTVEHIRRVTGGRWLVRPADGHADQTVRGLGTDTRTLDAGQAFLALRGERFDGHRFLRQAIDRGASVLIVDREDAAARLDAERCGVLLVSDTQTALSQLAIAYRRTLRGRVIAVTGSVGKTTTKQIIHTLLRCRLRGSASPRSYNNHIGVPLTILAADIADDYLIVEVGANAPGEIAALSRIVQPDIAVITAVTPAHLEGLGSFEQVLREKASLLAHLRENGLAVVNGDVEPLVAWSRNGSKVITFGRSDRCDLRLTGCTAGSDAVEFEINGRWTYRLPMLGEHNALNALAAIAVARSMQVGESEIAEALRRAEPPPMRLRPRRFGPPENPVTLINDAYNANPASMAAALQVLRGHPTRGRRIAILGDMLELGAAAPDYHRRLGRAVVESGIDRVVFIGPLCLFAAEAAARHWSAERILAIGQWDDRSTAEHAASLVEPGDTVLLKASRGLGLERIAEAIGRRFPAHAAAGVD